MPLLRTVTLTVTGLPRLSRVCAEVGSPGALAVTGCSFVATVNGSDNAVPDTCGANRTINVQVPAAGSSAWRFAPSVFV